MPEDLPVAESIKVIEKKKQVETKYKTKRKTPWQTSLSVLYYCSHFNPKIRWNKLKPAKKFWILPNGSLINKDFGQPESIKLSKKPKWRKQHFTITFPSKEELGNDLFGYEITAILSTFMWRTQTACQVTFGQKSLLFLPSRKIHLRHNWKPDIRGALLLKLVLNPPHKVLRTRLKFINKKLNASLFRC